MQVPDPSLSTGLRVAVVTGGLAFGGATTYLCNLGGEMVRRGIPTMITSFERHHPMAADFAARQLRVSVRNDRRFIFEEAMQQTLAELQVFEPTHVIAWLGPTAFEVLRYLPTGIGRVGVVHADDRSVYGMVAQYRAYLDRMVGVSRHIAEQLAVETAFSAAQLSYVPSGVQLPASPLPREPRPDQPLRILYLGRLDQEQKRVRLFPEILRNLCQAGLPFTWTIVGEGPERAYLEQTMVTGNPRQVVRFTGAVPYGQVPEYMRSHDIFLLTSTFEGMPLSLLEAMGQGLVPVVSHLPSGIGEVVDDQTGKLVAVDDVAGYAAAIVELQAQRAALAAMSQRAQERVRREFSVEAMTDRWLAELNRIASGRAVWPAAVRIEPILGVRWPARFRQPFRGLRSLLKKGRALLLSAGP